MVKNFRRFNTVTGKTVSIAADAVESFTEVGFDKRCTGIHMVSGATHRVPMPLSKVMEKLYGELKVAETPPPVDAVGVGGKTAVPPSVWQPLAALRGLKRAAQDVLTISRCVDSRHKIEGRVIDALRTEVAFAERTLAVHDREVTGPPPPPPIPRFAGFPPSRVMSKAEQDVLDERQRQIIKEGWTAMNDDTLVNGEMATAAAAFAWYSIYDDHTRALNATEPAHGRFDGSIVKMLWPPAWGSRWWKPKTRRYDLVRSGALIIAEIERLDRLEARQAHATTAHIKDDR